MDESSTSRTEPMTLEQAVLRVEELEEKLSALRYNLTNTYVLVSESW